MSVLWVSFSVIPRKDNHSFVKGTCVFDLSLLQGERLAKFCSIVLQFTHYYTQILLMPVSANNFISYQQFKGMTCGTIQIIAEIY